jgi:hypothetical protein
MCLGFIRKRKEEKLAKQKADEAASLAMQKAEAEKQMDHLESKLEFDLSDAKRERQKQIEAGKSAVLAKDTGAYQLAKKLYAAANLSCNRLSNQLQALKATQATISATENASALNEIVAKYSQVISASTNQVDFEKTSSSFDEAMEKQKAVGQQMDKFTNEMNDKTTEVINSGSESNEEGVATASDNEFDALTGRSEALLKEKKAADGIFDDDDPSKETKKDKE